MIYNRNKATYCIINTLVRGDSHGLFYNHKLIHCMVTHTLPGPIGNTCAGIVAFRWTHMNIYKEWCDMLICTKHLVMNESDWQVFNCGWTSVNHSGDDDDVGCLSARHLLIIKSMWNNRWRRLSCKEMGGDGCISKTIQRRTCVCVALQSYSVTEPAEFITKYIYLYCFVSCVVLTGFLIAHFSQRSNFVNEDTVIGDLGDIGFPGDSL